MGPGVWGYRKARTSQVSCAYAGRERVGACAMVSLVSWACRSRRILQKSLHSFICAGCHLPPIILVHIVWLVKLTSVPNTGNPRISLRCLATCSPLSFSLFPQSLSLTNLPKYKTPFLSVTHSLALSLSLLLCTVLSGSVLAFLSYTHTHKYTHTQRDRERERATKPERMERKGPGNRKMLMFHDLGSISM